MLSYRRFSLTWLSIPPQKKRFCSRSVDYPRRSLHCSRGGLARCFCTLTSGFTIISTNVNPKTANFERTNSTQKTQQNYVYINTILESKTERFESGLFALFFFFHGWLRSAHTQQGGASFRFWDSSLSLHDTGGRSLRAIPRCILCGI